MNQNEFDELIKEQLNQSDNMFGYKIEDRLYSIYYTNDEFKKYKSLLTEIKLDGRYKTAYDAYNLGKGDELNEKYNKNFSKLMPPKMASVASSSRYTVESVLKAPTQNIQEVFKLNYNHKKDAEIGVPFQRGGIPPQFDAYLCDDNKEIYIEAKCHEIFGSHSMRMKKSYALQFEKLVTFYKRPESANQNDFIFDMSLIGINPSETLRFDAKQAIAHILGVKKNRRLTSKLIFLFFKPCDDPIYDTIKCQSYSFLNSSFIQTIINNEFEVEIAFQESKSMECLSTKNYFPFITLSNHEITIH